MAVKEPSFTIGIEEEYLLVDRDQGALIAEAPPTLMTECEAEISGNGQVSPEFLQSQVEIGTRVCESIAEVRDDLTRLRRCITRVANRHGLAPLAVSTHPFATWESQHQTHKDRYHILAREHQAVARRLLISGMHVHVAIEDEDLRIDLLNQAAYFLPHLLALSTSSPYWQGIDTGLMSYRVSVWDEMPRTGLPEYFESYGEYQRHIDVLVQAGLIEDATKIWWDIRPSARFPTLEMRITDNCPRLEDTICIAALYRCILRMLYRLRRENQRWRRYANLLINENRWRAQRYGIDRGLLDLGKGEIVPYGELMEEMLAYSREDAEYFGCVAEVEHARTIFARGTGAHQQRRVFAAAEAEGADRREALKAVVDRLALDTQADL